MTQRPSNLWQRLVGGSRVTAFALATVNGSVVCAPFLWALRVLNRGQELATRGLGVRDAPRRALQAEQSMPRLVAGSWLVSTAASLIHAGAVAVQRAAPVSFLTGTAVSDPRSRLQSTAVALVVAVTTHGVIAAVSGISIGWLGWATRCVLVAVAAVLLAAPAAWADAWASSRVRRILHDNSRLDLDTGE